MKHYDWQPGNGTRYDLYYGQVGVRGDENIIMVSWMRRGGSGGTSMVFGETSFVHYVYLMEKMDVGSADAAGILSFLGWNKHSVMLPPDDAHSGFYEDPLIKEIS